MPDRPQTARTRRERARDRWQALVGPALRRAADPDFPAARVVDELLVAGLALEQAGASDDRVLDAMIDSIAPSTLFRREAHLALAAARLLPSLHRRPSFDEIRAAVAGLDAEGSGTQPVTPSSTEPDQR
jgi:hypothetical protein